MTGNSRLIDPRLRRIEDLYRQWRAEYDAGRLTQTEFERALDDSVIEVGGRYWAIGASTGTWYASDGDRWVAATPPTLKSPEPTAAAAPRAPASSASPGAPAATPKAPPRLALKFGLWCLLLAGLALVVAGTASSLRAAEESWKASDLGAGMLVAAALLLTTSGLALFQRPRGWVALMLSLAWIGAGFGAIQLELGNGFDLWWWPDLLFASGIAALLGVIVGLLLRRRLR